MDCKRIRSSPSSQRNWEHDVFLSFSGEDTRYNFTDNLFAALQRKGIFTFRDDVKVQQGEAISPQLFKAIERSRIFIVVFSRNYACSTWCLNELAKIVDCIKEFEISGAEGIKSMEQIVFPVFYDVDPSEVRKQSGIYEKDFADLEIKFKGNASRWRAAMTKVADIAGWHVQNKPESKIIDDIVKRAIRILGHKFSSHADDLVGIQSRAKELESLLSLGSKDGVQVVGICGMGGIGKTTLASVVYDRISDQFDAYSFLFDVSKVSKCEDYGLVRLQEQLLYETVNEEDIKIWDPYNGAKLISSKLSHLKTLIVLDDIDDENQLETLVGKRGWFGAGSRIIITSRNEHILRQYGVDEVYKVKLLNDGEALELFCRRAFKNDKPLRDYGKLTNCVLQYVKGLPLAIKVLGSSLFGGKVSEWTSFLNRMQESPESKIMDVLRTSLDGLVGSKREIFLDIACFFNGKKEGDVKFILECCGFYPEIGIKELIDRSLLSIFDEEYIRMHDLLQELGKKIIQEKYPDEPEKWSRLWQYKDFQHVLMKNKETKYVKAIVVEPKDTEETSLLRVEALSKMSGLRLLILHNVKFSGSLNYFPNEIKYLSWHTYPFPYFPPNFQLESSIRQILQGIQPFHNMRSLNLDHCKALVETPNFCWLPNLENLDLQHCGNLSQIHQSISLSLQVLTLLGCIKLKRMPDFRKLPNLVKLRLKNCPGLLEIDESIGVLSKLKCLSLNGCKNLVRTPPSIFGLSSLEFLYIYNCAKLVNVSGKTRHAEGLDISGTKGQSMPCIVRKTFKPVGLSLASLSALASSLTDLDLSSCNICDVPYSIGGLQCLQRLWLNGNDFITLPSTIQNLYGLRFFSLMSCKNLESLPELPQSILASSVKRSLFEKRLEGLMIFDCPKLVMIESCNNLAFSWLIRLLQEPGVSKLNTFFGIVIPGCEIPWWFKHRCSTPSIGIQVPPNVHVRDNNWLGLTLCVTFAVHDPHLLPIDAYGIQKICLYFHLNNEYCRFILYVDSVKRPITTELDHVLLIHIKRDKFVSELRDETDLNLVEFKSDPGLKVKKCGFRWIYKESVERLKNRRKHCTSNNMQIDDADDLWIYDSISTLFAEADQNW